MKPAARRYRSSVSGAVGHQAAQPRRNSRVAMDRGSRCFNASSATATRGRLARHRRRPHHFRRSSRVRKSFRSRAPICGHGFRAHGRTAKVHLLTEMTNERIGRICQHADEPGGGIIRCISSSVLRPVLGRRRGPVMLPPGRPNSKPVPDHGIGRSEQNNRYGRGDPPCRSDGRGCR